MDLASLEFPRHVHRPSVPGKWVYLVVHDVAECEQALAEGWSLTPILIDPVAPNPAEESVAPDLPKRMSWRKPKVRI